MGYSFSARCCCSSSTHQRGGMTMPLTQCRECGAQVSTEAHSCPHCGVPSPTSPSDALRQGSEPAQSTFSRRPTAPQRQRLESQPAAERNAVSATIGRARKYCQHCGNDIDAKAEVCPCCGVRAKSSALGQPGIAAVLSLIWVGLGQIYNCQALHGILSPRLSPSPLPPALFHS